MDTFLNFKSRLAVHLENSGIPLVNIFFAPYFADGILDLSGVEKLKPIAVVVYPRRMPVRVPDGGGVTPLNFELWVGYLYNDDTPDKVIVPRDEILRTIREVYTVLLRSDTLQPTTAPEVEFFDFDDGAGITRYSWGKVLLSVILR